MNEDAAVDKGKRAFRIAGIYALFGVLWIGISDRLLAFLVQDSAALTRFSMYKGWAFILATAALVFYLTRRALREQGHLTETRKNAEAALLVSEERFQLAMRGANDGLWDWDLKTDQVYYSPRWKSMLGYAGEELENHLNTWKQLVHPEDLEPTMALVVDLLEGRSSKFEAEFRLRHKDGHYLNVLSRAFPVHNAQGETVRLVGTHVDISERKRTENALQISLRFLEAVHKHTEMAPLLKEFVSVIKDYTECDSVGIRVLDDEGGIPYRAYEGFSPKFYETENPLSVKTDKCMCINVIRGDINPVYPFYTKGGSFYINGTSRFLATVSEEEKGRTRNVCNMEGYESVALVPFRKGERILGLIHVADHREDMVPVEIVEMLEKAAMQLGTALEKVQAEEALRKSEERYRTLVDNALVGVWRFDLSGRILYVNDAMARIFECRSPEGMRSEGALIRYKNPKDREALIDKLKKHGKVSNYELETLTKSGRDINLLVSASLDDGIISAMVLDITDHKRLEEQFRQAQKMEAVGLLAGGVAHDFNNILTAVVSYSHLTLMKLQENDPARHYIQQILEASDRATVLTQGLLAFSRKQTVKLALIDLNEVIKGFEKFLLRLIREDIELRITCTGGALSVIADRGQIEQMIMNLVANARDSMQGSGKLLIKTERIGLDREFLDAHGFGKEGEYAVISISDTGAGMDEHTKSKVFEPFFTTKEQGKGTGLGLSMVYGIVKKHDGFINVYSELGKGTTFKIYLPLARVTEEADNRQTVEPVAPRGGTETILVAEDDADLREVNLVTLNNFGYTVIEAVDGSDAVSKFILNKEKIRLVILDGIMPRMNGMEAFRKIKAMSPGIKCIFVSGYAEDIFTKNGVPAGEAEFVLKPFSPSTLLKKVREVLDR